MQEIVQLSNIEQLCENVTHAEKHTPDDKEHLHLRIHHDVLNPRSITTLCTQDPSRCTHHSFPFLDQDKIARCQQHFHAMFWQELRCKISDVGFCGMLAKSQCFLWDFLLHPEPLDFEMFQTSTPLPWCDPDSSTRVRKDNCFDHHSEPFQNGLTVQTVHWALCDCVELRLSCRQCSHTLRAGSKFDRRFSIELRNSGRRPQHGFSGCKVSIHEHVNALRLLLILEPPDQPWIALQISSNLDDSKLHQLRGFRHLLQCCLDAVSNVWTIECDVLFSPAAACTTLASAYSSSLLTSRSSFPMSFAPGTVAPFPSVRFSSFSNFPNSLGSASQVNPSPVQLTTRLSTFPALERPGPILPTRLISIEFSRTLSRKFSWSSSATATKSSPCTTVSMSLWGWWYVFGTIVTASNWASFRTSPTNFPKHLLAIRVPYSALFRTHSLPRTRNPTGGLTTVNSSIGEWKNATLTSQIPHTFWRCEPLLVANASSILNTFNGGVPWWTSRRLSTLYCCTTMRLRTLFSSPSRGLMSSSQREVSTLVPFGISASSIQS